MDEKTVALIRAAQSGDQRAFHELVAMYDGRIMALTLQLLKNKEDAEDIYQEVFIKAWRNLSSFEFKSDFYTWLYRIAANTCFSYRSGRHRHHLENISLEEGYHDAYNEENPDRSEQQQHIIDAVNELPQKQKTVFVMRYYQGHKLGDIATLLGLTTGTVKRYLHRATLKLRKDLAAYA
ncbi:MAG: sigma-70 family RNA polymerase sigma factor [Fidelibacterota bacterium]|nr:MAG: sigma-70 family RNA polymerase sigma factor [Candidatus Neomarinimicrobiota bacterium]